MKRLGNQIRLQTSRGFERNKLLCASRKEVVGATEERQSRPETMWI